MSDILLIIVGAVLVQNFVLTRFLGICPFMGVSRNLETALGMGGAVIFVMVLANAITWLIHHFLLAPYHLEYLLTIAFILVIASLVQLVEMILKKVSPALNQALGIYLPLITTNCAVLGCAILCITFRYDFIRTVVFGGASAVGFTFALVLFSGIRERLEFSRIPRFVQGLPLNFITAGILSMAFMGFAGLVK
ncbi:MAG: electron transport complex subunit RsxA [Elusimicrobia bacterium RIFOXYB2_FULL_49_7]|nr:MAG: electron transport complex subunit RsxA [Elusimicrobia bacterium RIFOXYB2_FULL_49_7]